VLILSGLVAIISNVCDYQSGVNVVRDLVFTLLNECVCGMYAIELMPSAGFMFVILLIFSYLIVFFRDDKKAICILKPNVLYIFLDESSR